MRQAGEAGGREVRWLLCDYGNVLSLPQDPEVGERLVEESGCPRTPSPPPTGGTASPTTGGTSRRASSGPPWSASRSRRPGWTGSFALDVAGWTRPNHDSLAGAARAAGRGLALAILSNAPVEIARVADRLEWLAPFSPRLFSCDLGEVKPDPAAYGRALEALGAPGAEVVFVDDKEENVAAARAAGLRAVLFEAPAVFDEL